MNQIIHLYLEPRSRMCVAFYCCCYHHRRRRHYWCEFTDV